MSDVDNPNEAGLYEKYGVTRLDGKPDGPYFVLSANDPFAPAALMTYADRCLTTHHQLAHDLVAKADEWERRQRVSRLRSELEALTKPVVNVSEWPNV